jgi:hypothetical protein
VNKKEFVKLSEDVKPELRNSYSEFLRTWKQYQKMTETFEQRKLRNKALLKSTYKPE